MDMREHAAERYLKVADVADGPLMMDIISVREGKYRPELCFDDGSVLGLNGTNCRTLVIAYGPNSDDWIGKRIELSVGPTTYQGKIQDSIIVKPISPPTAQTTPVTPAPKPNGSGRYRDMDDEIQF